MNDAGLLQQSRAENCTKGSLARASPAGAVRGPGEADAFPPASWHFGVGEFMQGKEYGVVSSQDSSLFRELYSRISQVTFHA